MTYCYVCGNEIAYKDWYDHQNLEKQRHGKRIYAFLKSQRIKNRKIVERVKSNKRIEEFS